MINVTLHEVRNGNHMVRMLRWRAGGKRCGETLGRVDQIGVREAKARKREKQAAFTKGTQSATRPGRLNLQQFLDQYTDRRQQAGHGKGYVKGAQKLSEKTIAGHTMSLRYLIQHLGPGRDINSIDLLNAEEFADRLEAGKLAGARKKTGQEFGLSGQSVRCHIRNIKAAFTWGVRFKLVQSNPFSQLDGKVLATPANRFVTLDEFDLLLDAAPNQGWRMLLALARLAGLRREAARSLPWSGWATDSDGEEHHVGVNWAERRIALVGNHKTVRRYRELPIVPTLHDLLLTAFESVQDESAPISGVPVGNVTRNAQIIVRNAGLDPIPGLFRSLRSSCENGWKQDGIAEPTFANWLGHSPAVSRMYYTSPTDQEFAAVSNVA